MRFKEAIMKLSVIVPVYRVADTLRRCVDSIRLQELSDYELILVDDCSDDDSDEMCDRIAAEDSNVLVIHRKENGGLSAARNSGIDVAHGEYITFVDSDDYLADNTYKPLIDILDTHPEYDILEYPVLIGVGGVNAHTLSLTDRVYTDMNSYWLYGKAYTHSYACNKIYRRTLFQSVRFPEGKVFEDMHTLPALLSHARIVATTGRGLYHYCYNAKGITSTAQGRELSDLLDAHLSVLRNNTFNRDRGFAEYYAHILNIQFDVYNLTGKEPELGNIHVCPITWKLMLCNIIGVKRLCQLKRFAHKIKDLCH